jgi:hypothetical protein
MTTSRTPTVREAVNSGNPAVMASALQHVALGTMLGKIKVVVASLSATATPDITSAAVKAAATITGITLQSGENLPAIGVVVSLRISASGTATSLGTYGISDAGGTAIIPPGGASAAMGVALLSDDGKTITFPNTVTGFVLEYFPAASGGMTATYPVGAP